MKQKLLLVSFVAVVTLVSRSQGADQNATKSVTSGTTREMDAGVPQTRSEAKAEVEITGTLKAPMRTKKFVAFVAKEPCDPKVGAKKALRTVAIDPYVSMNFFLEVFVPQGSTGHVCGAGYDEHDKLVLFGAYAGNPLTFRGKGEVAFSQVSVTLEPVSNRPGGGKTPGH
jgi:hypothetical protein